MTFGSVFQDKYIALLARVFVQLTGKLHLSQSLPLGMNKLPVDYGLSHRQSPFDAAIVVNRYLERRSAQAEATAL